MSSYCLKLVCKKLTCFPLAVNKADPCGEDKEDERQSGIKMQMDFLMTHAGRLKSSSVNAIGSNVGNREPNQKYGSGCQWKENFTNMKEY